MTLTFSQHRDSINSTVKTPSTETTEINAPETFPLLNKEADLALRAEVGVVWVIINGKCPTFKCSICTWIRLLSGYRADHIKRSVFNKLTCVWSSKKDSYNCAAPASPIKGLLYYNKTVVILLLIHNENCIFLLYCCLYLWYHITANRGKSIMIKISPDCNLYVIYLCM